jgi:hypothetical protein
MGDAPGLAIDLLSGRLLQVLSQVLRSFGLVQLDVGLGRLHVGLLLSRHVHVVAVWKRRVYTSA